VVPGPILVPGASGLKNVIEPNSGKVFAGLQPESLTAVPMQLCVRYYSAGNSAYYNLAYLVVRFYRKIRSVTCNSCKIGKIDLFYRKLTRSCDLNARPTIGPNALLLE
jgi:hypothetical protein